LRSLVAGRGGAGRGAPGAENHRHGVVELCVNHRQIPSSRGGVLCGSRGIVLCGSRGSILRGRSRQRPPCQVEAASSAAGRGSVVNHPHFSARSRGGARRRLAAAGAAVVGERCFRGRRSLRRWEGSGAAGAAMGGSRCAWGRKEHMK
jgi:hypothetical protein